MKNKTDNPKPPDILFQYRPPTEWAFGNLSRQIIHLGAPEKFNDPYDCNIPLRLKRLTAAELIKFGKELPAQAPILNVIQAAIWEILPMIKNASSEEEAAYIFNQTIPASLTEVVFRKRIRVACFSEHNDNLLMWSHYAERGRGFCVAFDTQNKGVFPDGPTKPRIMPINYKPEIPAVDNLEIWKTTSTESWWKLWVYKSEDWKYEKEWRLIKLVSMTTTEDSKGIEMRHTPKIIKAVYLGTEATDETKARIRSILGEKYSHAELWQGRCNESKFKVEFDRIR